MYKYFKFSVVWLLFGFLSACVAQRDDTKLIKPLEKMASPYDNGSIFKVGFNERPLFEEKRVRNVGEGLIMTVPASALPPKKEVSKDAEGDAAKDAVAEDPELARRKRRRDQEEESAKLAIESLVGTIPMTVISILDNGFYYVSGGKHVTVDDEDKYVRITGVIDPSYITGGNAILSTQLSEVSLEVDQVRVRSSRTATTFSEGQSTFGRFFQSFEP